MLRQIPMYLVLAAHLGLSVVCWFAPKLRDLDGVALLIVAPAQVMMLAIWLTLGRSKFVLRLLAIAVVICNWAMFELQRHFNPSAVAFYLTPLAVIVVGGLGVMRLLGWRIQNLQRNGSSNFSTIAPQPPQYTLRQIGIVVTAISLLFAINMYFQITKIVLGDNDVLAVFLLTVISFALAVWATLGAGRLALRLLLYAAATSASTVGLIGSNPRLANDAEFIVTFLVPDVVLVPVTLLAYRIAGFRVSRQVIGSTNGDGALVSA